MCKIIALLLIPFLGFNQSSLPFPLSESLCLHSESPIASLFRDSNIDRASGQYFALGTTYYPDFNNLREDQLNYAWSNPSQKVLSSYSYYGNAFYHENNLKFGYSRKLGPKFWSGLNLNMLHRFQAEIGHDYQLGFRFHSAFMLNPMLRASFSYQHWLNPALANRNQALLLLALPLGKNIILQAASSVSAQGLSWLNLAWSYHILPGLEYGQSWLGYNFLQLEQALIIELKKWCLSFTYRWSQELRPQVNFILAYAL